MRTSLEAAEQPVTSMILSRDDRMGCRGFLSRKVRLSTFTMCVS